MMRETGNLHTFILSIASCGTDRAAEVLCLNEGIVKREGNGIMPKYAPPARIPREGGPDS